MQKQIYIHVGFPKTASGFLQRSFFPHTRDIELLTLHNKDTIEKSKDIIYLLNWADDRTFENSYDLILEKINSFTAKKILISAEALCYGTKKISRIEILHRLKICFPDAKILFVIRDQINHLKSLYSQLLKFEIPKTISFKNFLKDEIKNSSVNSILNKLDFDYIISEYEKTFDIKNITVLEYEMLVNNCVDFAKRVDLFLGSETNIRENMLKKRSNQSKKFYKQHEYILRSGLSRIVQYSLPDFLSKRVVKFILQQGYIQLDDNHKKFLREYYAEGNSRVNQRYHLKYIK